MGYIWGGRTGETPESIKRKRDIADALMVNIQRGQAPRNVGEGIFALGDIATALEARNMQNRATSADLAGRQNYYGSGMDELTRMLSGQPQAAATPAATPTTGGDTFGKMMNIESGGNPNAVSPKGATGVAQIMPATARDPGFGLSNIFDFAKSKGVQVADNSDHTLQSLLRNPDVNAGFGKNYFDKMTQMNGGNEALGAAAYNAGPGAVQKAGGIPNIPETQNYVSALGLNGQPQQPQQAQSAMQTAPPLQSGGTGNVDLGLLMKLANDPYAPAGGNPVVQALLERQLKQSDPAYQLQQKTNQLDYEQKQHPDQVPLSKYQQGMLDVYKTKPLLSKGYMIDGQGNTTFIPGGPADPAVITRDSAAKVPLGTIMDDQTVESLAKRVFLGDPSALTGLGRGVQGAANLGKIQKRVGELAAEYQGQPKPTLPESDVLTNKADYAGDVSGARRLGGLQAMMDAYATEANGAIDIAQQASRAVPRSTWMPVNRLMQAIQSGSNDPALAQFNAAINATVNTYAKAVSPVGTPTDSSRARAMSLLEAAQSPEAFEAVLQQFKREINIAHNAARTTRGAERAGTAADQLDTSAAAPGAGSSSQGIGGYIKGIFGYGDQAAPAAPSAPAAAPAASGAEEWTIDAQGNPVRVK